MICKSWNSSTRSTASSWDGHKIFQISYRMEICIENYVQSRCMWWSSEYFFVWISDNFCFWNSFSLQLQALSILVCYFINFIRLCDSIRFCNNVYCFRAKELSIESRCDLHRNDSEESWLNKSDLIISFSGCCLLTVTDNKKSSFHTSPGCRQRTPYSSWKLLTIY